LFLGIGPANAAQTRLQILTARVGLLLPALALAGAPFTSGALAKVALKSNVAFLPGGWADLLGILLPLAAVGTALKMARFLWLTWPEHPHPAEEHAKGLWPPWLCLVGAMLVGVWLLPGALGSLPVKRTPEKLWLATWPLLAGGGLAMLGAWLRRWFSGDLTRWLPAGDLGVLLERLLAPVQRRLSDRPVPDHADGHDGASAGMDLRGSARLAAVGGHLARIEHVLRAWPVTGAAWLLLIGVILWLLAVSRN